MNNNSLAVIIPAYDCKDTIRRTVISVLKQSCLPDEIIVVPNGSAQGNYDIGQALKKLCRFEKVDVPDLKNRYQVTCEAPYIILKGSLKGVVITIMCKRTGNKSDALNLAMLYTECRYVITLDADTYLERNSICNLIEKTERGDNVIAVGGSVFPSGKHWNILTAVQLLEYMRSFYFARRVFNAINGILLLSGAFTLFRREVVLAAGGFCVDIIGEDMEIVVRLQYLARRYRTPYRILYSCKARCFTDVPTRFSALLRQRVRWHVGLLQSLFLHTRVMLNPRCGASGMITYPYMLLMEAVRFLLNTGMGAFLLLRFRSGKISLLGIIVPAFVCYEISQIPSWVGLAGACRAKGCLPDKDMLSAFIVIKMFDIMFLRLPMECCKIYATVFYPRYKLKWLSSK